MNSRPLSLRKCSGVPERALAVSRHGQAIALVIRAGLGANLVSRDGSRGVGGSQTGGLRHPHGQPTGQQEQD